MVAAHTRARAAGAGVVLAVGVILALVAGGCTQDLAREERDSTDVQDASEVSVPDQSKEELERAKLAAEIRSIVAEDEERRSAESRWLRWAPFLTALVGIGTLVVALVKQRSDVRLHRSKELAERRAERTRRYDETLNAVVKNMGSDDARVRLNAAASLAPLLRLSGPSSHADESGSAWTDAVPAEDLLPVFTANLRIEEHADTLDILVRNLGLTLRKLHESGLVPEHLDLTRVGIRRLRVPGIRLGSVDIAFSAIVDSDLSNITAKRLRGYGAWLERSRFTGANLQEARLNNCVCIQTRFHDAQLVSATFKHADLNAAQFHRARLQSAHFEDATCIGTNFLQADVADAWFCDSREEHCATMDEAALLTIANARNWRSAHLPADYRGRLEQISAAKGLAPSGPVTTAGADGRPPPSR